MPLITLSDEFWLSIKIIDDQHENLVKLINKFYDSLQEDSYKENLSQIISSLVDYAEYHFATEEELMKKFDFSEFAEHQAEHNAFILKIKDFSKRYETGKMVLSSEVTRYINNWVNTHLLGTDKKCAKFLNTKGVS